MKLVGVCALIVVQALTSPGIARADVTGSPASEPKTSVMIGGSESCLVNPPTQSTETGLTILAPLAAALAGKTFDIGYDALANYLNDVIKSETSSLSVSVKSTYFYRMTKQEGAWTAQPALDCIVVARGRSGPLDVKALKAVAPAQDPKGRFSKVAADGSWSFPVLQRLGFSDYPDVYLEFAFERDPMDTVFRLQPRIAYLRQTSVKPTSDGKVDLNLTLAFSQPGAAGSSSILPFRLSKVQPGSDLPLDAMTVDNPWAPMLPPPDSTLTQGERTKLFAELPATPVNLTVTLEETGAPGKFLSFMSRLMAKSQVTSAALRRGCLKSKLTGWEVQLNKA
jgi:hypothetical protein